MKKLLNDRRFKLIRNIFITALALFLLWFFLGMPAFTKGQAFRRAMREHFLTPGPPEVFFGEDSLISALAEVDGVYVQTGLQRSLLSWQHTDYFTETKAVDGVYIIPLLAYGQLEDGPDVAVKADGARAELTFFDKSAEVEYTLESIGRQDGWFLFRFAAEDKRFDPDKPYSLIIAHNMYRFLEVEGYMHSPCSFTFISYDAAGAQLLRVEKNY